MTNPEPRDLFSKSRGMPPPGERGMKRLKNSKAGSFSSNGNGIIWACPRTTCVELIFTTAGPCFSASSEKSGRPRVWAKAREVRSQRKSRLIKRFMVERPPDSTRNEKQYG